jgi:hypothetical protein
MNTIKECILSYIENEKLNISKIKITDYYKFNEATIIINLSNGSVKTIVVEKYTIEDISICEMYDENEQLLVRAKGFESVI